MPCIVDDFFTFSIGYGIISFWYVLLHCKYRDIRVCKLLKNELSTRAYLPRRFENDHGVQLIEGNDWDRLLLLVSRVDHASLAWWFMGDLPKFQKRTAIPDTTHDYIVCNDRIVGIYQSFQ